MDCLIVNSYSTSEVKVVGLITLDVMLVVAVVFLLNNLNVARPCVVSNAAGFGDSPGVLSISYAESSVALTCTKILSAGMFLPPPDLSKKKFAACPVEYKGASTATQA